VKITVVGAGIVGCAVAHELASRGARVLVVDPRGVGQGATRASAGILAPYIEGHIPFLRKLGLSSLALYDTFIERVRAEARHPVEYERSGTLQVAHGDEEARELAAIARDLESVREGHSLLDAREARQLEPALSDRVVGALLVPRHGYVAAAALTSALVEAATAHGVTFSSARVADVTEIDQVVRLATSEGPIESDAVVVAAGSWFSQLVAPVLDRPQPAVKPIRGQLVHLNMPARAASRVVWRGPCYLVPWRDGSVLVGATVEDVGFDERVTAGGVQMLLDLATDLLPELKHATLREARVGLRPGTPDELPVIGRSSTMRKVFYATGHYRSGVLLAPLTAAMLADLVIDGCARPELAVVRPDRFGL
jgi:glycine oxidase